MTVSARAHRTTAELDALLDLLGEEGLRVETVTLGHGRDAHSVAAAQAFAQAWESQGGTVLAVVDWPEEAASWLRQARRFAAGDPDAWVVAGPARGWAQMVRRLRQSTTWDPRRTFRLANGAATLDRPHGVPAEGGMERVGEPGRIDRPWPAR